MLLVQDECTSSSTIIQAPTAPQRRTAISAMLCAFLCLIGQRNLNTAATDGQATEDEVPLLLALEIGKTGRTRSSHEIGAGMTLAG